MFARAIDMCVYVSTVGLFVPTETTL